MEGAVSPTAIKQICLPPTIYNICWFLVIFINLPIQACQSEFTREDLSTIAKTQRIYMFLTGSGLHLLFIMAWMAAQSPLSGL